MFKLNMNALRKAANCEVLPPCYPANAAKAANESGKSWAEISRKTPKLAGLAGLAVSSQPKCTLQNDPVPDPASPASSEQRNPNDWRELATAYHLHPAKCHVCIAASKGAMYGLRCGAGAALWVAYQAAP